MIIYFYFIIYCRYVCRLYHGEASVILDNIADSLQQLNPDTLTDISCYGHDSKSGKLK